MKELDKVVSQTTIKKREGETFLTALIHRLEEMKEIGEVGHTRDIVITVPRDLVDEDAKAQKFVAKAGAINRNESLNLPTLMEARNDKDKEGKQLVLIDFVFSVSKETDIDSAIEFLNS